MSIWLEEYEDEFDEDLAQRDFVAAGQALKAAYDPPKRRRGPEPAHRRTGSKIHADSRRKGSFEHMWFKPFDKTQKGNFLTSARRYDRLHKKKGSRTGPLGYTGLLVLERLLDDFMNYKTGQLDPSLEGLMQRTGLCRGAVVTALKRLYDHGFIRWVRRFVETGVKGLRGPQVEQATNAYQLDWPDKAKALIGHLAKKTPLPDDVVVAKTHLAALLRSWEIDFADNGTLLSALRRWGVLVDQRESAKRSESAA